MAEVPAPARGRPPVPPAVPDVVVEAVEPLVDGGRFAAKTIVGDSLEVSADVFAHGHELVRAIFAPPARRRSRLGVDSHAPSRQRPVRRVFRPHSARTPRGRGGRRCRRSGQLGARRPAAARSRPARSLRPGDRRPPPRRGRRPAREQGRGGRWSGGGASSRRRGASRARLVASRRRRGGARTRRRALLPAPSRTEVAPWLSSRSTPSPRSAAFSSWYELFPRSASPEPGRPGTLRDVIDRLGYVASLGFDVLYLPPVHPIGDHRPQRPRQLRRPRSPATSAARGRSASRERRPRRHRRRARHVRGLRASRRGGEGTRHRGGDGPRLPELPRPPVGKRASRLVPPPARRLHRLRREPAEALRGHLPDRLPHEGPGRAVASALRGDDGLGRARRAASSGSTIPTRSRSPSGSGCSPRRRPPTPTSSSSRRPSPARR